MPTILSRALPWFHIDRARIYAVGSSMGGQERLLLVAFDPGVFTAAAALDSATDMAARYRDFKYLGDGAYVRRLARIEIGGTPTTNPRAYSLRSPMTYIDQLAFAGVPLEIWWSTQRPDRRRSERGVGPTLSRDPSGESHSPRHTVRRHVVS
ncbi:MAG: alpha/beta hydrolase family protein [Solirubrobacteraceae bacterium]